MKTTSSSSSSSRTRKNATAETVRHAKSVLRSLEGTVVYPAKLLGNGDSNTKLRKNGAKGFLTRALSLSPAKSSGFGNTCTDSTFGCVDACLDHQGLASVFKAISEARKRRTELYYRDREWLIARIIIEIDSAVKKAERLGKRLAVRLNMYSDILWELIAPELFALWPNVEWYDYTKHPRRIGAVLPNYWVTFSRSERNEQDCIRALRGGKNVAVVFADLSDDKFVGNRSGLQGLPKTWYGFTVYDGNLSDLRFDDPRAEEYQPGYVIGLGLRAHSIEQRERSIKTGFAERWNNASGEVLFHCS